MWDPYDFGVKGAKCWNCGADITDEGVAFCPVCGLDLQRMKSLLDEVNSLRVGRFLLLQTVASLLEGQRAYCSCCGAPVGRASGRCWNCGDSLGLICSRCQSRAPRLQGISFCDRCGFLLVQE